MGLRLNTECHDHDHDSAVGDGDHDSHDTWQSSVLPLGFSSKALNCHCSICNLPKRETRN